jgi:iron complex outermembrane receptor protein
VEAAHGWTNFSPQAEIRYKWTPDIMTYANIAKGFKAGSFQVAPVTPADVVPVNPETTIDYELGIKADFLDRRLTVDGDIYRVKIKDQQLQSVVISNGLLTSTINNASSSHVDGAELTLSAQATKYLSFTGNVAYTHSVFDSYKILPTPGTIVDRSGSPFPNSPKLTYFLSGSYTIPLPFTGFVPLRDADFILTANYRHVDATYTGSGATSADPILPIPQWHRVDVSGTFQAEHWSLRLFADNVTNQYIVLTRWQPFFVEPAGPFLHDRVDAPRRYGAMISYKF